MRIAQVAPCWTTVPPSGYGGIELVIANLTEELVGRGHEVTLFASGGSTTSAKLVSHYQRPPGLDKVAADPLVELPHVLRAYSMASEFDVVHDHTFPLGPCLGAHLGRPPVLHTLHTPPSAPESRPVHELIGPRISLVAVANHQRESMPQLNYVATVYNGIDPDRYPFNPVKEDYLLFVGAMRPTKGVHLAVQAARRLRRSLVLVTKMAEPMEFEYFEEHVRPFLTPGVELLGEISFDEKVGFFEAAAATLFPSQWPEPFGLVMIESLACGTPVVAWRSGAAPEIVEDGRTGFLSESLDAFVEAIERVDSIEPAACRQAVEQRFTTVAMADGYERAYERVTLGADS